jgi:hypothetical protein
MAAPNIASLTSLTGKTAAVALSTTSPTLILDNPASSGTVLRVTLIRAVNVDGSVAADVTINLYSGENLSGTATELVQAKEVAVNTNVDVIDRNSAIYLEENRSLGATASAGNDIKIIAVYEEIS